MKIIEHFSQRKRPKTIVLLKAIYEEAKHMAISDLEAKALSAYMIVRWNQGSLHNFCGIQQWVWLQSHKHLTYLKDTGYKPEEKQFRFHRCILDLYTSSGWKKYINIAAESYNCWTRKEANKNDQR